MKENSRKTKEGSLGRDEVGNRTLRSRGQRNTHLFYKTEISLDTCYMSLIYVYSAVQSCISPAQIGNPQYASLLYIDTYCGILVPRSY